MEISPSVKHKAEELLRQGRKLEAIQYLRQQLALPLQEANALADHLEKENTFFKSGIHNRNRSTHGGGPILKFFGIMLLAGIIGCGIIGSYIWDD